jgi:pyridinium-3,5-biscarboxylic acid mononucleotide sulfurtransferase
VSPASHGRNGSRERPVLVCSCRTGAEQCLVADIGPNISHEWPLCKAVGEVTRGNGGRGVDKGGSKCQVRRVNHGKLEALRRLLGSYGSCVVAYSGGVDSVLLARVAVEVLGAKALAVLADSPSLPRRELREAVETADRFGIPLRVVQTGEFDNPEYLANPANRCYFCKHELFSHLVPLARAEGYAVIVYGENASDLGDFRPGSQAAAEFEIRAPLKEVGLTKPEIRELSEGLGLPTFDKPEMACLSSRIPYGEAVDAEKLRMIEAAENLLRDQGFRDIRVRHHELRTGHLARIEVGSVELGRFLSDGVSGRVVRGLQGVGYLHVTVDLRGYRRGSANETLVRVGEAPGSPGAKSQ